MGAVRGTLHNGAGHSDIQTMLDLGVIVPEDCEDNRSREKVSYERRRRRTEPAAGHGRGATPTHLPVDTTVIEPEGDLTNVVRIGEEESWYFEMQPGSLRIKNTIRPKYVRKGVDGVVVADLPALPVEKGNAGPGLMAQVTTDKYLYHLPLDRLRKKFKNDDIQALQH